MKPSFFGYEQVNLVEGRGVTRVGKVEHSPRAPRFKKFNKF